MSAWWLAELVLESLRALQRHKLRSTLTLLGVIFGVAAVIAMMAVGEGAQRTVLREISGLGLRNIILQSIRPPESATASGQAQTGQRPILRYGLTFQDVDRLAPLFPDGALTVAHPVRATSYFRAQALNAEVLGVPAGYFELFGTRLLAGRLLSDMDDANAHRAAVVSEALARDLAAPGGPVGQTIRIGRLGFDVVGVARVPGPGAEGRIFIPYRTARLLYGTLHIRMETGRQEATRNAIGQIVIHLPDETAIPEAARVAERILKEGHAMPDYQVTVPLDLLLAKQKTQRVLNLVLVVIAAISLLVGGIGIMNIMLATVTERIPEIGVRRALGATRRDILWQFTAEAVVLSTVGGLLGCLLGGAMVPGLARWIGWAGVFTPGAVLLALLVSWLVGVVFGLAPAIRAARLDPVACLRHE
jgi:putative ABC transport system permease protein